jgi:hypothetical protein
MTQKCQSGQDDGGQPVRSCVTDPTLLVQPDAGGPRDSGMTPSDAGSDGGGTTPDAGVTDGGMSADGGMPPDGGGDAGLPSTDAGMDGGLPDGGDAGP